MSLPPYIFDHVDRRLERLVSELGKPHVEALVRMYGEALQELEDSAYNLIVERLLDSAVGAQLDQWGRIVGEARDGANDDRYRAFIEARIQTNISNGEIDRMTRVLAIIALATGPVWYQPLYPAGCAFSVPVSTPAGLDASRIKAQMLDVAPAGVDVAFIVQHLSGGFSFAGDSQGLGFGEGKFGGLI